MRRATFLVVALVAASLTTPESAAAATPRFKLPFPCGASYVGSTYSGHGYAIDFNQAGNADKGDPVLASAAGTVTQTKFLASNGQITITHGGGWETKYAHMSRVAVRLNQKVRQGQLLGFVDDVGKAAGDHLHFEQDLNGVSVRARFDGVRYTYGKWVRSTNGCGTAAAARSETTPPTRTSPASRFVVGKALRLHGPSVPVTTTWSVNDAASGVAHSVLERKRSGRRYSSVVRTTDTRPVRTTYVSPSARTAFTFRVRATDRAGNVSSYATAAPIKVRRRQDGPSTPGVRYAGPGWRTRVDHGRYSGGTVRTASRAGNSVVLRMSGQDVAIVATRGPGMGRFRVYVDGVAGKVVDLYRSSRASRRIVWQRHFAKPGQHVVELRVLGTRNGASAGTRVELDAFLILQR